MKATAEAFIKLGITTADRVHAAKHAMPYLAAENNVSDESIDRVGWSAETVKDGSYMHDLRIDYLVGCSGCATYLLNEYSVLYLTERRRLVFRYHELSSWTPLCWPSGTMPARRSSTGADGANSTSNLCGVGRSFSSHSGRSWSCSALRCKRATWALRRTTYHRRRAHT